MNNIFNKGDMVLVLKSQSGNGKIVGKIGVVKKNITIFDDMENVPVEFPINIGGHSLDFPFSCEYGYGWYIDSEKLHKLGVDIHEKRYE